MGRLLDFFRFHRRPLAAMQPPRRERSVPLGMEATDLHAVDRVNRQNQALDRTSFSAVLRTGHGHLGDGESTPVIDLPDNETYTSRYYAAFQKDKRT